MLDERSGGSVTGRTPQNRGNSILCYNEEFSILFAGLEGLNVNKLHEQFSGCTRSILDDDIACRYKVDGSKDIVVIQNNLYNLKTTEERKARCLEVYDLAKIAELTEIVRGLKPLEPSE